MNKDQLNELRLDLSLRVKNGVDFIIAATIIWSAIAYIWTLSFSSYDKSVLTFIVGAFMLPLAFLLSKVLKTQWKIPDNPLQPLGLWLNFAQLFYFPFLVFILLKYPDYFLMSYVIITGAHFFPYAWLYTEIVYAVFAGIISIGSLLLTLWLDLDQTYLVGVFMSVMLFTLSCLIWLSYRKKSGSGNP